MAKQFFTNGTGSQQTLTPSQNEKVAVYDTVADAEADLANLEEGQIVATPDTGDELAQPVDTVQAGDMHAVTSNAVAEANSYSTAEHFTGKYWKNGKKVYSILKEGTLTAQTYSTSHGISNIDEICKFESFVNLDGLYLPMFYAGSTAFFYNFVNATQLQMRCCSGYVNSPYRVYIEYTKTTDTATRSIPTEESEER